MRLICPNCDAQYEVPDEVMPLDGRDVQCSNCGQTWFQAHPDQKNEPFELENENDGDEEIVRSDPPVDERKTDGPTETEPEPDVKAMPFLEAKSDPEASELAPKRKELDPAVSDILREEAEIEIKARQNDPAGSVESQPDLGLDDTNSTQETERRAREASERMARMRGEDPAADEAAEAAAAAAALGSRRDLLPDIEEINSSLRSSNDRGTGDTAELEPAEVRERRSFRRGFFAVILIVLLMTLLYVYAPDIIEAVPGLEPALSTFVSLVENGRVWLDTNLKSLLNWLDEAALSSGS